jgi:hypothetical protein
MHLSIGHGLSLAALREAVGEVAREFGKARRLLTAKEGPEKR